MIVLHFFRLLRRVLSIFLQSCLHKCIPSVCHRSYLQQYYTPVLTATGHEILQQTRKLPATAGL